MDGLLLVDKPAGLTSHDVVDRLRRRLGGAKTGHFGTLDPLATGLLIVAAGKAVRFNRYYAARDKSYQGRIRLGVSTDTYDAEGVPTSPACAAFPSREAIAGAIRALSGAIEQVPPPFSAKKLAGRPLYSYARKGRPVEARPVPVFIHEFEAHLDELPFLEFSVRCSSGTYVRSLAHDLGQALGCGAFLAVLRRTAIGEFDIRAARPLGDIERSLESGEGESLGIPLDHLLEDLPGSILDAEGRERVRNGRPIPPERIIGSVDADWRADKASSEIRRLIDADGHLIALAKIEKLSGSLTPFLVLIS